MVNIFLRCVTRQCLSYFFFLKEKAKRNTRLKYSQLLTIMRPVKLVLTANHMCMEFSISVVKPVQNEE